MGKTYKVIFEETITHKFYVDAESAEDAKAEFNRQVNNDEIDFSYGEVTDSSIEVFECD